MPILNNQFLYSTTMYKKTINVLRYSLVIIEILFSNGLVRSENNILIELVNCWKYLLVKEDLSAV